MKIVEILKNAKNAVFPARTSFEFSPMPGKPQQGFCLAYADANGNLYPATLNGKQQVQLNRQARKIAGRNGVITIHLGKYTEKETIEYQGDFRFIITDLAMVEPEITRL